MFVCWARRGTGNSFFPKHHWLTFSCPCAVSAAEIDLNRSVTPFLCFVGQMFCCQLEELIHWLYTVVDVTDSWVPPSPDARSVSASLHRYLVGVTLALHPPLSCAAGSKPGITGMLQSALALQSHIWEHREPAWRKLLAGQPAAGGVCFKIPPKKRCSFPCLARSSGRMWLTTGA